MKTNRYFLLMILVGCASNSGVVPIGDNTFMVSRQAATGFSGLGTLKVDALREANYFCLSQNKKLHVISATEAEPPFILGNFPKADVRFNCVDSDAGHSNNVSADQESTDNNVSRKDVDTELQMLDDLHERGILSDEEFDAEKKKLLEGN